MAAMLAGPARVTGVDAARGLALVAMMAVHIFPAHTAAGSPHPAFTLAAGRAAALFALLAGVGLALASGGPARPAGRRLAAVRVGVLARAALLVPLGLLLGSLDSPPAVILAAYGVAFALVTPFLGLTPRALVLLAAGWVLLVPVASLLARSVVPDPTYADLGLAHLSSPGLLVGELLLTGYYPAVVWLAYLLVGLAVGRIGLHRPAMPVALAVGGVAVALAAKGVSALLVGVVGGPGVLAASVPAGSPIAARGVEQVLAVGAWGQVPTGDPRWLLVSAPHTGTPLDLAHTIGTSLAVLGVCLLLTRRRAGLLLPLAAAGSMTLTLYSLHVVELTRGSPFLIGGVDGAAKTWWLQVAAALALGVVWRAWFARGPLESASTWLDHSARRLA